MNTEEFILRLEHLMEYYNLNASSFADKIGVQRSGISHLLSGRNKPSLDFVLKIIEEFPAVNLYWILYGTETFLKSENASLEAESTIQNTNIPEEKTKNASSLADSNSQNEIYKIVIFYSNGNFKEFNPGS